MHRLLATAAALLTFGTLLLLAGGVGMFLGPDSLVPSGLNITMTSLGLTLTVGGFGIGLLARRVIGSRPS